MIGPTDLVPPRRHFPTLSLELPGWVEAIVRPGDVLASPVEQMQMAIHLARENVERRSGGPFGAVVVERDSGRVIAAGVNVVVASRCSLAHAEAMALALAQQSVGRHDLAARGITAMELVCSAQPCCQCFGIIWWSGVRGLVVGARAEDVESIAGFREGPLPSDWADRLRSRQGLPAVHVATDVLRDLALEPLHAFRDSGQNVYGPGEGS